MKKKRIIRNKAMEAEIEANDLASVDKANERLNLARKRVELPSGDLQMKYYSYVDSLTIRLSDGKSTYSTDDMEKGIIYNYDAGDKLVSIEILDLYGTFAS